MLSSAFTLVMIFAEPLKMKNDGWQFLWAIPLIICIATVYKATKVEKVTDFSFVKESITLSATILGFMLLIAIVMWAAVQLLT